MDRLATRTARRLRILFVSALYPYPLHSGGQIRVYNLLKHLVKKHSITLAAFTRSDEHLRYRSELSFLDKLLPVHRGRVWQIPYLVRSLTGPYALLLESYNNGEMRRIIKEELNSGAYDLVHLEPWYVRPAAGTVRVPVVSVEHNIEYILYTAFVESLPVYLRPLFTADVRKLRSWEEKSWREGDHIVTVSDADRNVISKHIPAARLSVVSNGVDPDRFTFKPSGSVGAELKFLFVGNFSWFTNVDAAKYLLTLIWPAMLKQYPQARLICIGPNVPASINRLTHTGRITVMESVEDIAAQYHAADIMLAPIRIGGGTKYKILEAMASGLPVVTTTVGAAGLPVASGRELMIADTPQETVAAAGKLVHSPAATTQLVTRARTCIERNYTWQHLAATMENVWQTTLAENRRR